MQMSARHSNNSIGCHLNSSGDTFMRWMWTPVITDMRFNSKANSVEAHTQFKGSVEVDAPVVLRKYRWSLHYKKKVFPDMRYCSCAPTWNRDRVSQISHCFAWKSSVSHFVHGAWWRKSCVFRCGQQRYTRVRPKESKRVDTWFPRRTSLCGWVVLDDVGWLRYICSWSTCLFECTHLVVGVQIGQSLWPSRYHRLQATKKALALFYESHTDLYSLVKL